MHALGIPILGSRCASTSQCDCALRGLCSFCSLGVHAGRSWRSMRSDALEASTRTNHAATSSGRSGEHRWRATGRARQVESPGPEPELKRIRRIRAKLSPEALRNSDQLQGPQGHTQCMMCSNCIALQTTVEKCKTQLRVASFGFRLHRQHHTLLSTQ